MRILALALLACVYATAADPVSASDVRVRASTQPATVSVGDVFSYVVEIRLPAGGPEPQIGDIRAGAGPFRVLERPRSERGETGSGRVVRVSQRLACFDHGCVPRAASRTIALPAARVSVGGEVVSAPPVAVVVRPRVTAESVAGGPSAYRRQTALPEPDARFKATAAVRFMGVLAGVVTGVALLLLASAAYPFRRRVREDALGRAIRLLRESARHPGSDRRRAADLLARIVGRPATLSEAATEVAWSSPEPSPRDVEWLASLADRDRV